MEINTKIFVGDFKLIKSERVLFTGSECRLQIDDVNIFFLCVNDDKNKEPTLESTADEKNLYITLKNYTNPLGTGHLEPRHAATISEKKIYMSYYLYTIDVEHSVRIIDINLFTLN